VSKRGDRRKKKKRPQPRAGRAARPTPDDGVDNDDVGEGEVARPPGLLDRFKLGLSGLGDSPSRTRDPAEAVERDTDVVELTDDGLPRPRWGLGEVFGGFAIAIVIGGLAAGVILTITGYETPLPTPGGAVGRVSGQVATGQPFDVPAARSLGLDAIQQLPFWAVLLVVPYLAARFKGNGWVRDFHIRMERSDVLVGLGVGIASQLLLVTGFYWLLFQIIGEQDVSAEARQLTDRATSPLGVLLLFLIVGVGAPIAEEVFFRGLSLRAFRKKGWGWWPSIIVTAVYFGATHLQPLQFPALVLFGVVVGWLVQRTDRLGPAIWAHVGFNLTAAVVLVWNL
jgi:membrane protease YdiL (CAAX protease family)